MKFIRTKERAILHEKFKNTPIVAILGPRQCGKTTLAHQFASKDIKQKIHFFDLENPTDLARLENPMLTLEGLSGYIIIDEIQRKPNLFSILRVLVDKNKKTKYLILGSASRDLIAQSSETLAGRISYFELGGFSLELIHNDFQKLWLRGSFPRSYLATSNKASSDWRTDYISTFLERDIPNLGINIPAITLRRLWGMLSHYHGQIFNASEIGQSLGYSDHTIKKYLDILSGTFIIRQLNPWFYNTKKRLVKRPKIYFRDSGLFHTFLSCENLNDIFSNPKLGASWEGFVIEQVIQHLNLRENETYFWKAHTGAELDLFFNKRGKSWGIEVKYNEAPTLTKSMISAIAELSLAHLWIIYPGKENYKLDKNISVISLASLTSTNFNF